LLYDLPSELISAKIIKKISENLKAPIYNFLKIINELRYVLLISRRFCFCTFFMLIQLHNQSYAMRNETFLMFLSQKAPELVSFFLELPDNYIKLNEYNRFGTTALMFACQNNNIDNIQNIETYVELGALVNLINKDGWTALICACYYQHNPTLIQLLIEQGAIVDHVDNKGITALGYACHKECDDVVRVLLENDANVNFTYKLTGWTPLIYACYKQDNIEIIKLLLDYGADVNYKSVFHNATALTGALKRKNRDIIELLLNYGAVSQQ
jgi:ankyrin repeat protein